MTHFSKFLSLWRLLRAVGYGLYVIVNFDIVHFELPRF